jgi:cytochrome b6-f complex iron-sulfur subunit
MDTSTAAANNSFEIPKINRREFLYYLGGASLALAAAQTCSLVTWYTAPHVRYIEEEGYLQLDFDTLSLMRPIQILVKSADRNGRQGVPCWLNDYENRLLALNGFCPFEGTRFYWVDFNYRFECPMCGSKFTRLGKYIEGPAYRSLDRFVLIVTTPEGTFTTPNDGSPVSIEGATSVMLNINRVIQGAPRI